MTEEFCPALRMSDCEASWHHLSIFIPNSRRASCLPGAIYVKIYHSKHKGRDGAWKKLARILVDRRHWFALLMLAVTILCGLLALRLEINTDMSRYLPSKSEMSWSTREAFIRKYSKRPSKALQGH